MRYVLILLGLLMYANLAEAIDCKTPPDCASLGYSKGNDPNCVEDGYLNCPFDQDYKVCVQYNCEALGFTESDKTSWCADLIECKGNSQMTLCRKPCFATDYNSLKELAESGHCKVVTMRDDITIPPNQSITLAANTIIDGGGYTLQSSGNKANYIVISAHNNTGLKNIKIRHTQTGTQEAFTYLKVLTNTNHVFLENIDVLATSDDQIDHWTPVFDQGTYDIRGKLALDIQSIRHLIAFRYNTINFTNAQVSINIKGVSGDVFGEANVTFTNSTIDLDVQGVTFVSTESSTTFINSQANLKGESFLWGSRNRRQNVILDGSSVVSVSNSVTVYSTAVITLKNNSVLNLSFNKDVANRNGAQTNIESTNTTDTLVVNGTTYKSIKAGTTELLGIGSSGNWARVE